jgi:hypothetical protein
MSDERTDLWARTGFRSGGPGPRVGGIGSGRSEAERRRFARQAGPGSPRVPRPGRALAQAPGSLTVACLGHDGSMGLVSSRAVESRNNGARRGPSHQRKFAEALISHRARITHGRLIRAASSRERHLLLTFLSLLSLWGAQAGRRWRNARRTPPMGPRRLLFQRSSALAPKATEFRFG